MNYEDALKEWGARKLEAGWRFPKKHSIDRSTVNVEMEFNEGYACCGGSDPHCYCSFAESPSANVVITGTGTDYNRYNTSIDHWSFDFATILKEIVEAGGGSIQGGEQ